MKMVKLFFQHVSTAALIKPRRNGMLGVKCGRLAEQGSAAVAHVSFSERVSGDWLGFEADFFLRSATGTAEPQEIPHHYVPDEFRAWDVSVMGFETLMSSTVDTSDLVLLRTRALPAVGCEADAVATEVLKTTVSTTADHLTTFADTGSFTCVPESPDLRPQKISVCICDLESSPPKRLRVSTVAYLPRSATVTLEQRDGEYSAGAVLPGCGGPISSFATNAVLARDELGSGWTGAPDGVLRGEQASLWYGLPEGISLASDEEKGLVLEVGWIMRAGVRKVIQVVVDSHTNQYCTSEWTESQN